MSTVIQGTETLNPNYDAEDQRIGRTLTNLMFTEEMTPEGYINRRRITHGELAKATKIPGKPNGVNRTYIAQLCSGAKHMNNELLYAISRALGVSPIAIKVPDGYNHAQAGIFEGASAA
jgi:hypothetical protein